MTNGILYIVATPIGNLSDISQRAIHVLSEADLIACEDTRVTQKLLNHYQINTKTISYHKFSEKERSSKLITLLSEGKNIALVSDAGTPLISDPGSILVKEARNNNIKVIPIPGCSAIATILSSVSNDGLFAFCGFFPQKIAEVQKYKRIISEFNLVFYESPNRIIKTLETIREVFGEIEISMGRELTKIHEDIQTFSIADMLNYLTNSIVKGEIVFVVHKTEIKENIEYSEYADKLIKKGYSAKDISIILSTIFDIPKNIIYKSLI